MRRMSRGARPKRTPEGDAVRLGDALLLTVEEAVAVGDSDAVGVRVPDADSVRVIVTEAVSVGVAVHDSEGVGVRDAVPATTCAAGNDGLSHVPRGWERATIGMARFGAEQMWHQFTNATENLVQIPGLWHKNRHRLRTVAVFRRAFGRSVVSLTASG